MIFYFSGTGNSKQVAKRIGEETKDRVISIADSLNNKEYLYKIKEGEALGFVFPTYAWGLPSIVIEFLEKVQLEIEEDAPYTFLVGTYGSSPGKIGEFANKYLKSKGINLDGQFGVKMPDTWTPIFDLSDTKKVKQKNKDANLQIDHIIKRIAGKEKVNLIKKKSPMILGKLIYNVGYENMRKTKRFIVEDTCISCRLCEKICPSQAIRIVNGRPEWVKEKCIMCLGCLHQCPSFSIQYGKNTKKHGQYTYDKFS